MTKTVVLAGATGDLGGRILRELLSLGAHVRVVVRPGLSPEKRIAFEKSGAEVREVEFASARDLTEACKGADVVLSALSGLDDVIIGAQTQLLNAAVTAKVPRFIPSDFAIDFTVIPEGENRNLNLRESFRQILDRADIRATSVLNGAFMELLTGEAPFILNQIHRILCFGDQNQKMDFTTKDNVATYTARAAMDHDTPRFLKVAGDSVSAVDLQTIMTSISGKKFKLLKPGGLNVLKTMIKVARFVQPAPGETYPAWQGMQYMHNMYKGDALLRPLDNDRYEVEWTKVPEVLKSTC